MRVRLLCDTKLLMERRPDVDVEFRWLLRLSVAFSIVMIALPVFVDEALLFFTLGTQLFLSLVSLATWSIVLSIRYLERRALALGLVSLALPLAVAWATFVAGPMAGDVIHFAVMRPYYDREVLRLPKNGARYEEFNWGGMLFASRGVVYDETDQIGLPRGQQSREWIARLKNTDLLCGNIEYLPDVRSLGGHYYLTGFGC